MITEAELLEAIEECESARPSLQLCEKLACLYTVYDHLYSNFENHNYSYQSEPLQKIDAVKQVMDRYGDSEFLSAVEGLDPENVMLILDELMSTLEIMTPRLYRSVMSRLK